ncbi:MAG TPA: hypothetical protein V6C96_02575 [Vampirovibrionales bacterium]
MKNHQKLTNLEKELSTLIAIQEEMVDCVATYASKYNYSKDEILKIWYSTNERIKDIQAERYYILKIQPQVEYLENLLERSPVEEK